MITYGGPELFVGLIVFVVTPVIYILLLKRFSRSIRVASIAVIWAVGTLVAYGDVHKISKEGRRLCRQEAGLKTYRTVEATGVLGPTDIEYWADYGFEYVEGLYKGEKTRFTVNNGVVERRSIPEFKSRYQIDTDAQVYKDHFEKITVRIVDRKTGDVLGEIVSFKIYPGWLDKLYLGSTGFSWIPARCDGDYVPERGKGTLQTRDLIRAVVKAKN